MMNYKFRIHSSGSLVSKSFSSRIANDYNHQQKRIMDFIATLSFLLVCSSMAMAYVDEVITEPSVQPDFPSEADGNAPVDLTKSKYYTPFCRTAPTYMELVNCVNFLDRECQCMDDDAVYTVELCIEEFGRQGYKRFVERQLDLELERNRELVKNGEEASAEGYNHALSCLRNIHGTSTPQPSI